MLQLLDSRTLFLAASMMAGIFAPIMFVSMRVHKTYDGYGSWAFSELAFAVLFFTQAIRGLVSNFWPVIVGNTASCVAMVLLARGMYEFCGKKMPALRVGAVAVAYLGATLYFYFVAPSFAARTMLAGIYLAIMPAYVALPLLGTAPEQCRFSYRFASTVLLFGSVIGTARVLVLWRASSWTTYFFAQPVNKLFYLADLALLIANVFSFFLLTNERSIAELQRSNSALATEIEERHKTDRALRAEVAERKSLESRLKELVITDELTGVLNRRGLMQELKVELQRARRLGNPLSVLALDLDRFKQINDRHGHAVGDAALSAFASLCRESIRATDTLGRTGGEEFVVLLPATNVQDACRVAEKLCGLIEAQEIQADSVTFSQTVSIGVAQWGGDDASGERMLAAADRALYTAKQAGRNCVRAASLTVQAATAGD